MTARALLEQVAGRAAAEAVGDEQDLRDAGLDSSDLVRLVLLVEERCGLTLDADAVDELRTLADIDRLIERAAAPRASASGAEG